MLLVYWGAVVQYLLLLRVHESLLSPQTKIYRWNPDVCLGGSNTHMHVKCHMH